MTKKVKPVECGKRSAPHRFRTKTAAARAFALPHPIALAATLIATLFLAFPAQAQSTSPYPVKPINLIIALAPGGAADIIGRALGQRLHEDWGQPVVIENRGGANTQIAAVQFSRAAPDGYTLLVAPEHTFTTTPLFTAKIGYDPENDFVPISGLISVSHALALHTSVPAGSIAELVALSKTKQLTYASIGAGSSPHLSMAMFQSMTGLKADPVQYRGGGPALADVIAGHVPMLFIATGLAAEPWRAGRVKLLGIASQSRLPELPEVPAFEETLPGFRAGVWFGLFGPRGLPRDIVGKLNGAVHRIMAEPAFKKRFVEPNLFEAMPGDPDQFAARIKADMARWGKVIAEAGLKAKEP